ncbi:hypothetical protein FRE64_15060 [Euhalothece natronophila Z-M001]|uniref:DUF4198 domain-containing protein n=1 Tax=Euhalothece natronophila Z-M001 TaxID=522448 RepID=A0A5B8NQ57_9CHRO|nr:hypothetical protein [Euhalothece natronophila]QDZ41144.1 hypothetical protein FRE64_15060 [Euhalothece natronophila Z-M001]
MKTITQQFQKTLKLKRFLAIVVLLFSFFLFAQPASAHLVETRYNPKDNSLEIQALFSTGELFDGADVVIHPPSNSNYLEIHGFTDEDGKFVFHPDYSIPGVWSVEIGDEDYSNHWDMITVPVTERDIQIDEISHVDLDIPDHHHYNFASQIAVGAIALTCGICVQLFRGKLKF